MNGFSELISIGGDFEIILNNAMTSLTELDNLDSIGGDLRIYYNDALTSLTGLDNVTSIGGGLSFFSNNALNSLSGLENVTSIGENISISYNDDLKSLTGLDNVISIGEDLKISNNHSLSTCEAISICNYLASPSGDVEIYNNAEGCNSQEEVEEVCETVFIEEENFSDKLTINPNPFSTSTTIAFESTQPGKVELKIYNQLGELVEVIQTNTQAGKQTVTWDASNLPSGIYFVRLQIDNELITRKMIKLK